MSNNKFSRFYGLFQRYINKVYAAKMPDKEQREEIKADLCLKFSTDRTARVSELSHIELTELTIWLNNQVSPSQDDQNKMRRKIIALFRSMNFEYYDEEKGERKADMQAIDAWLLSKGTFKKKLSKLDSSELVKTVSQVEAVQKKHVEALRKKFATNET